MQTILILILVVAGGCALAWYLISKNEKEEVEEKEEADFAKSFKGPSAPQTLDENIWPFPTSRPDDESAKKIDLDSLKPEVAAKVEAPKAPKKPRKKPVRKPRTTKKTPQ